VAPEIRRGSAGPRHDRLAADTCCGFQHALLEDARDVCGLPAVHNAETTLEAEDLLIVPAAAEHTAATADQAA
jgi:CTP synthase (UTP-ammonia lyase)